MNAKATLAVVVALLFTAPAFAESRSVLITVTRAKDNQSRFSIRSDEKGEQKESVPVEAACAVIKKMKGWGSVVHVFVVADQRLPGDDFKKLLDAINDNSVLELTYLRQGLSKAFVDHYLKTQGVEQPGSGGK